MRNFGRNLVLWCIIVLLLAVIFNILNGNFHWTSGDRGPEWLTGWGPFALIACLYVLLVGAVQRRRQATLKAREAEIAATAHADAEQIISLLREIRTAQLVARSDHPTP